MSMSYEALLATFFICICRGSLPLVCELFKAGYYCHLKRIISHHTTVKMMSSIDPSNDTTVVTAAKDQDKKEEVHSQHTVESLLQKLREKDAVIAEKDEQLSVALANNNTTAPNHSLSHIPEDRSAGDGEPNHFGSLSISGVSTFADYLQSRRSSKARWHNSVLSDLTHATNATGASNATVRTAEEMRVIRRIDRRAAAEWDHLSCGAAGAEEGTISGEDHGHGSRTPWYNPPIQRQRWCEDQSLPHINWGDLFFDLFYVGAAFNL